MRLTSLALVILVSACAASSQSAPDAEADQAIARRIDEICALPEAEREAELERLKKESGLILHCGGQKDQ